MPRDVYTSDRIAPPVGPFSPAARAGGLLFLSGQVAQDPSSGKLVEGGIDAQASQIFRNVAAVLEAADRGFDDVVRVGVYLRDMGDFKAMNAVYERHFARPYPARTVIGVASLPLGAAIEIDVVAR
jgi:2-iminobutanoate/2-iminopropanoate deaminase